MSSLSSSSDIHARQVPYPIVEDIQKDSQS
jgi:hypothetical protein